MLKNYRPVSNLSFVSKILEKVVASRLECHLQPNSLLDDLQSANNSCVVLAMLDLSAAFDVIDHKILFQRLEYFYGISGPGLAWIRSYLTNKTQRIAIGSVFLIICT